MNTTVKVTHLVFGLIFLGIAGLWALGTAGHISWSDSGYLVPAVLVGAGLIGLIASLLGSRSAQQSADADTDLEDYS